MSLMNGKNYDQLNNSAKYLTNDDIFSVKLRSHYSFDRINSMELIFHHKSHFLLNLFRRNQTEMFHRSKLEWKRVHSLF